MIEVWKDVVGYEEYFKVSNIGNIFSKRSDKNIKLTVGKTGYYTFSTKLNGRNSKAVCFKVHRLVATAFIPNTEEKPQVNHIDGNKLNNSVTNLEWVTAKENVIHAHNTGLAKGIRGQEHGSAKFSNEIIVIIKEMYSTGKYTHKELSDLYGVGRTTITDILNNKSYNKD